MYVLSFPRLTVSITFITLVADTSKAILLAIKKADDDSAFGAAR
jgi:hypothetical protein